jgi:hypothetical protein
MKSILLVSLIPLTACGGGGLGQATLLRECASGDAGCHRVGPLKPLAVGAVFHPDVAIEIPGTTAPSLSLASADPGIVGVDAGGLIGRAPGVSAVTITVDTGTIVDFIHVWVAQPTAVTFERDDGERVTEAIQLVAGEDIRLHPALWDRTQRLEGTSALEWSLECDGPCPAALLRDGTPQRRRLRAQRPGKASLVIAGLGLRETLAVEVVP